MELKDFEKTPDLLIGKTVLYEYGMTYSAKIKRSLIKIEKVTKTGFRLFTMPNTMFGFDGNQKGLNGKMDMGTISRCKLLKEEEVNQLIEQWKYNKEERTLREKMKIKLETMTFDELKKMELI